MNNSEKGAVAITGGASGIGLETARLLGERGHAVFLIDMKREALDAACRDLGLPVAHGIACDVTDEVGIEAAIRAITAEHRLAGVVNCAGIAVDRPAVETSVADFRRIVDVNLTGSFIVSRAAARHWLAAKEPGAIVNITSVSGLTGNKGRSAYGASKGGQNLLTLVLATELGAAGIRVNAVAPGPVDTPLTKAVHTEDVRRQWIERVPQRRYGTPREIAGAVAFLLSEDAAYVNGQILAVDGGFIHAGLAP
ncbi:MULTISPECIES: SDR family NAD(P)-dependent oxidoreductase [Chelatococcus]|uniref:NAD(P)-dependent dehydrogenase (Short-subunit alcohol dehydrogenase family) n=1 Tax=Chelatococcus caeni TaxID=1348468 RepID=A0A840C5C9_9HYPH|nr:MULTISPECIES: SDR family oxidoreductase [Chelatococcus]ALA19931.1 oxidoreductase [Chelatococcus sp. CO-6]MBB4018659.1 NAD(P)-dependent dehydrogenase (short-subunit alcohol dehydrogenase family) [Chelatococcus caeni]